MDRKVVVERLATFSANIASGVAVAAVVSPVLWVVEIPGFSGSPCMALYSLYLVLISLVFFALEIKFLSVIRP